MPSELEERFAALEARMDRIDAKAARIIAAIAVASGALGSVMRPDSEES